MSRTRKEKKRERAQTPTLRATRHAPRGEMTWSKDGAEYMSGDYRVTRKGAGRRGYAIMFGDKKLGQRFLLDPAKRCAQAHHDAQA